MTSELGFHQAQVISSDIKIRTIHLRDLRRCLREGYADFNARPTFGFFLALIYPLFAVILTVYLLNHSVRHLIYPVVSGLTLLGPIVCVWLFAMSRARSNEGDIGWRAAFEFIHTSSFAPLLALSLLMMLLYVAWLFMAQLLYTGQFGSFPQMTFAELLEQLFVTRRGLALVIYGTALGMIFSFVALAVSVFAFPLALDKPVTAATAIAVSFRAVIANFQVMIVWGLIVVGLLIVGSVTLLIGLGAVLPILGHATWHLYKSVVAS